MNRLLFLKQANQISSLLAELVANRLDVGMNGVS